MNGIHPRFINREDELERIRGHIEAWGTTRILVIDGPGGIGKTRLLEEVYEWRRNYKEAMGGRLAVTEVINLDDVGLQVVMSLGRRIALEFDPQRFHRYLEETDRIVREESKGLLTPEALERYVHESDKLFLDAYSKTAQAARTLLLIDTMEAVLPLPIGRYLTKLVTQLPNTCVLVAGQKGEETKELIEQTLKRIGRQEDVSLDYILLQNFEPEISAEYLAQTPIKGYLDAHPGLYDNLVLLTEGKPLWLALAVEWLLRDVSLPDLLERSPKELQAMKPEEKEELRRRFEAALIAHVRYLRDPLGDLILDMAYAAYPHYSFDAELLSAITGWSDEKSQKQLEQIRDLFFVKTKPGGVLVLHDEVARLVRDYVWPQLDPFRTRRQQLSLKAVGHYQDRLQRLEKRIQEAWVEASRVEEWGDLAKASEAWRYWAEKRREQWETTRELLHHTLEVDPKAGYALFVEKFAQATNEYQFLLRAPLVEEIAIYEEKFKGDERYEVSIRIAKCLLDETEYQSAYDKARDLLDAFPYQDHRRVDIFIQLANNAIRLGRLEEGRQYFGEALKLCEEWQIPDRKWWAMAENGLGWAYRVLGRWDEAIQHWHKAFDYSTEIGDRYHMAMILNNLGYVYYLTGDSRSGLALSQQALEIAESVGMERQIAANHSALGEIYLALGQYPEALANCEEAMAFFEREADEEWMAIVYHELARVKRHQAFDTAETTIEQREERLEEALRYAERSLQLCEDYGLYKEAPVIHYRVGSIKLDLGEVAEAEKHLRKSIELSEAQGERFHFMVASAALADLAYLKGDKATVGKIAREAREWMSSLARADYPLFLGRILRTLAEVYLDEGEYDLALETYVEALTHIGHHGGYGKYRFDREVKRLQENIAHLPKATRSGWSSSFIEHWRSDPTRARENPEVVTACLLAKLNQ